jgi:hypothetical protein
VNLSKLKNRLCRSVQTSEVQRGGRRRLGRAGRGHTADGGVLVAERRFQVARRGAVTRKEEEGAGPACELETELVHGGHT